MTRKRRKSSTRKALDMVGKWQSRADYLVRKNPGRSIGWIADQIAKEEIGEGYTGVYIRSCLKR